MMQHPYSFVVLRYVPDQGAGEGLNVGVVIYSQEARFIALRIDARYERLSRAFAKFDGRAFRHAMADLVRVFRMTERTFAERPLLAGDREFSDWLRTMMPDMGGSLSFTPARHGIAEDLKEELAVLFDRMVESQKAQMDEAPRRDDAQVWRMYEKALTPAVSRHLRSKSFVTSSIKVEFEHAVKNGAWHVIQPISMDFKQPESMQRKASQWVGTAVGLQGTPDLGTIFFLLGAPAGHRRAYDRARALLDQAPIRHEIIEERDADQFSRRLLALMEHQPE